MWHAGGMGEAVSQEIRGCAESRLHFRCGYAILMNHQESENAVARDGETMNQYERLLLAILSETRDKNLLFSDLRLVPKRLDFQCHIKGDYFIYTKSSIEEIINIRPTGNMAKPYQVK